MIVDYALFAIGDGSRLLKSQVSADLYYPRIVWCGTATPTDPSLSQRIMNELTDVDEVDRVAADSLWRGVEAAWAIPVAPPSRDRQFKPSYAASDLSLDDMARYGGTTIAPRVRAPRS